MMTLDELKAKIDNVSHQALRDAERKALRAVGKLMLDAVMENAPTKHVRGGDLAPGELKAGFRSRVHIATDAEETSDQTSSVTIAPLKKIEYVARFVENGHINAPHKKGGKQPEPANTPAHPFVRPAFDANEQKAIDIYTETMTEEVKKAME